MKIKGNSGIFTYFTGTGTLAASITSTEDYKLKQLKIHLSAVGVAGNLTVQIDSAQGAVYDTVLYTVDMSSKTDHIWVPEDAIIIHAADVVNIAWANGSSRTYGLEILHEVTF